jgi:hypothetical protein
MMLNDENELEDVAFANDDEPDAQADAANVYLIRQYDTARKWMVLVPFVCMFVMLTGPWVAGSIKVHGRGRGMKFAAFASSGAAATFMCIILHWLCELRTARICSSPRRSAQQANLNSLHPCLCMHFDHGRSARQAHPMIKCAFVFCARLFLSWSFVLQHLTFKTSLPCVLAIFYLLVTNESHDQHNLSLLQTCTRATACRRRRLARFTRCARA